MRRRVYTPEHVLMGIVHRGHLYAPQGHVIGRVEREEFEGKQTDVARDLNGGLLGFIEEDNGVETVVPHPTLVRHVGKKTVGMVSHVAFATEESLVTAVKPVRR